MHCITLTTDFGTQDWFVGTMKGVILNIAPTATIVDLTHGIAAGDIAAGAFALAASCGFFPKGTIHVAVIDPGVGSKRKAIAVKSDRYVFIGPDNGVLSLALQKQKLVSIHVLENQALFLNDVSATFHGRDIFAAVAAHIYQGIPLRQLGPPAKEFSQINWPKAIEAKRAIRGAVVYVDKFGNAITNISAESLRSFKGRPAVHIGKRRIVQLVSFYGAVAAGRPAALVGSSGLLEIALNGGSASRLLRLGPGSLIEVRFTGNDLT